MFLSYGSIIGESTYSNKEPLMICSGAAGCSVVIKFGRAMNYCSSRLAVFGTSTAVRLCHSSGLRDFGTTTVDLRLKPSLFFGILTFSTAAVFMRKTCQKGRFAKNRGRTRQWPGLQTYPRDISECSQRYLLECS